MTRSELVERISAKFPGFTTSDISAAVGTILDSISTTLIANDRVEIRGFGSFELNYKPPRVGRNPRTGQKVPVPAKYVPHFKAGKELRERVNSGN